jgi:membrane protease YdiL (CAAX protease family)
MLQLLLELFYMNLPETEFSQDKNSLNPLEILALAFFTGFFVFFTGGILSLVGGGKFVLLGEIFIIAPAFVYAVWRQKNIVKVFRLNPISLSVLLHSIAVAIVAFVIIDEVDRLIAMKFPIPEEQMVILKEMLTIHSFTDAVIIFLSAVVFAAVAEEMFFRGLLQRNLELVRDPAMTMVLTSVFFALAHFSFELALQILLLGLLLAYMSWKADSIFPAIIIHATNNFFSLLLFNISEEKTAWYASEGQVKYIWVLASILLIIPLFKSFNNVCKN